MSGGVYILSRKVNGITRVESPKHSTESDDKSKFNYTVKLDDFPDTLSCRIIISPPSYVPVGVQNEARQLPPISTAEFKSNIASIARCIAIIDQALLKQSPDTEFSNASAAATNESGADTHLTPPNTSNNVIDSGILVFPPSSVTGGSMTHSASALINGEGSLATPKGKCELFLLFPLNMHMNKISRACIYNASVGEPTRKIFISRKPIETVPGCTAQSRCRSFQGPYQTTLYDLLFRKSGAAIE